MTPLRFAMIGAGFWSKYQLAAWGELPGVQCLAICDLDRARASERARAFDVPSVYDDPHQLFRSETLDFVDIVTSAESHAGLVELAAANGVAAICQKPLAPSFNEARGMVNACARDGVPLLVHENWRWQAPIRAVQGVLKAGTIGRVFRARIQFANSFPVFQNQPSLKELDRFILVDIGTHIFDVARYLFGEATSLFCQTKRVNPEIRGEDVATVMLTCGDASVLCLMSYASRVEHERFPETFLFIEGDGGSIELGPDFLLRVTTAEGTTYRRVESPRYPWADPAYELVHASIVPCHENLLRSLRGTAEAETTGEDNLKTLRLVEAAYESARTQCSVEVGD
jgi:D-apiose dehydrogenase